MSGLIVDLFAGGGGASTGVAAALGREPDIAINHDPIAIACHKANHPTTRHLEASIWEVRPREATGGAPVDLLWASPDCTHFSVAKGDVPRSAGIRSLAWVVVRWAREVRPRLIALENVPEFQTWGPLGKRGRPLKSKRGRTFRAWVAALRKLGYVVDWRVLDASQYGAPTKRRRLFLVARRDGAPVVWPEPTHGDPAKIQPGLFGAPVKPWRTAAECIDWSLPCPSIFERRRPLADKTMWRIAEGLRRYVFEAAEPFIVRMAHGQSSPSGAARRGHGAHTAGEPLPTVTGSSGGGGFGVCVPSIAPMQRQNPPRGVDEPLQTITTQANKHMLVAPTMIETRNGEREGQAARVHPVDVPHGTVTALGSQGALVSAWLAKHFGGVVGHELDRPSGAVTARDHHSLAAATLVKFRGTRPDQPPAQDVREPLPTISAGGIHAAEVRAFLTTYYGTGAGQPVDSPMRTITAKHRLGLVTVHGVDYQIVDIGMRMLEPHELLRAQFGDHADGYTLDVVKTRKNGRVVPISKADKVRLIGNSVCPDVAAAVVRANRDAVAEPREAVA